MRTAFTLIEIMLVVLLLGIVAVAVSLNLQGPLRQAQMADVIGQIENFDLLTRHQARREGKALRIVLDLANGRIRRTDEDGALSDGLIELPSGYRLLRLLVRGKDAGSGEVRVSCSAQGFSPTYAVLLSDRQGRQEWFLIAGLTGELMQVENETQLQGIFAAIGNRPDVD